MNIKTIDVPTLKQWLDSQEVVLIDVREPDEIAQARIPGSISQPLGGISLEQLPSLDNKKLVMYCKAGMRSRLACEKLLAQNHSLEVYNLEGGIMSWIQQGQKLL
ncbi:MAG: rhodanese-like domain-containing protein [Legionella sp.]|nr:rhodanese-like domain-containing protein [Legionella sp.]